MTKKITVCFKLKIYNKITIYMILLLQKKQSNQNKNSQEIFKFLATFNQLFYALSQNLLLELYFSSSYSIF